MSWRSKIYAAMMRMRKAVERRIALLWQHSYRTQYRLGVWKLRYGNIAFYTVLILLVSASAYLSPALQYVLASYYSTGPTLDSLRGLILNVGSALIGAAAIVTSLVMFAMQVNIERMPHGLFRRLSSDRKLLGAFALAFLLAIGVATLSTFVDQARLAQVVLAASWAVVFILICFMYAYPLWFSSIHCSNWAYSFKTLGRSYGHGLDEPSARYRCLNAMNLQVPRRHQWIPHTTWPVPHFSRSTIDGPMAQNERFGTRCRLLGAMRNREIMKFQAQR